MIQWSSVEFTFDPGDDWETVTAVSLQLPAVPWRLDPGPDAMGRRAATAGASEAAGGVSLGKVTKVTTGWGDTELNHSGIGIMLNQS